MDSHLDKEQIEEKLISMLESVMRDENESFISINEDQSDSFLDGMPNRNDKRSSTMKQMSPQKNFIPNPVTGEVWRNPDNILSEKHPIPKADIRRSNTINKPLPDNYGYLFNPYNNFNYSNQSSTLPESQLNSNSNMNQYINPMSYPKYISPPILPRQMMGGNFNTNYSNSSIADCVNMSAISNNGYNYGNVNFKNSYGFGAGNGQGVPNNNFNNLFNSKPQVYNRSNTLPNKAQIINNNNFNTNNLAYYNSLNNQNNVKTNINHNTSNIMINNSINLISDIELYLSKSETIDESLFHLLKGKFVSIIKTQNGSRVFQKYLIKTSADIIHMIFLEIIDKLNFLIIDQYANYFCHKIFPFLSIEDRWTFMNTVYNILIYR